MSIIIRRVSAPEFSKYREGLIELLQDAVDSGASVGFLPPLTTKEAQAYWDTIEAALPAGHTILLVAEEDSELLGTVQLHLATKSNGLHRAEVAKLLVNSMVYRQGFGRRLMQEVEREARFHQRTTLVLDTLQGAPSELLYQELGYTAVGAIPAFARVPSGELEATVVYYKLLV
ncbi:GNAT family N-acetyltransferase [Hymenobacter wooponensis]|uniref:GNAT family N-acetyltransferase n=1 Tax=Hymenobacter wooponensis TaxID=1525360 RepID=A0A4Z0MPN0_9BACT|nr:GNAT family N-acetyltransferase [Hymenobacter wooponensis]TGD81484.1 GNAT family N-acetyltransferase [Hymenobacter wooponensis]